MTHSMFHYYNHFIFPLRMFLARNKIDPGEIEKNGGLYVQESMFQ